MANNLDSGLQFHDSLTALKLRRPHLPYLEILACSDRLKVLLGRKMSILKEKNYQAMTTSNVKNGTSHVMGFWPDPTLKRHFSTRMSIHG